MPYLAYHITWQWRQRYHVIYELIVILFCGIGLSLITWFDFHLTMNELTLESLCVAEGVINRSKIEKSNAMLSHGYSSYDLFSKASLVSLFYINWLMPSDTYIRQ